MRLNFTPLFMMFFVCAIAGLSQNTTAVDAQKLNDAKAKGFRLDAGPSVPVSVTVDAVLLPARVCGRLFGKEIAENYVAVELTVANKNQDAAFLVHSVVLDYSKWLLGFQADPAPTVPFQASTLNNQVASVEYRAARGEAQDAQQWSARNWTIRALTLAGVIATGSEFAFAEQGVIRAIGAFTGQVVPAAGTFWPDGSPAQMDRISDFGFRTNKVIPKASSDIIVAFFPIDRFITPGLKKIYLKSPAVFFLPQLGVLDPKLPSDIKEVLQRLNGGKPLTPEMLRDREAMKIFESISMNRIRITVGGVMAVDVDTIPARIDSVTFDPNPDWTQAGTATGIIHGTLLTNGAPAAIELKDGVQGVTDPSSDTELHFTITIPTGGIAACTTLQFHVTKTKDSKTVDSNRYTVTIPHADGSACPAAK